MNTLSLSRQTLLAFAFTLLALLVPATSVRASGIITGSFLLPPEGNYISPNEYHAYTAAGIAIANPIHSGFTGISRVPSGPDEIETFGSIFQGDIYTWPGLVFQGPITMNGTTVVRTFGRANSTPQTGTFQTEMLSMDLSGGGVLVRESPTLATTGQTTITDIGGGNFHIDSFFDVFTELSMDGGNNWIPSDTSTHMVLNLPEPGRVVLLGMGLVALIFHRRRKGNAV